MLRRRGERARHLESAMRDTAHYAERQITNTPVDTGRLASSLRGGSEQTMIVTNDGFELGTTVPYARYVFRGTRYMSAQPPTVDEAAIAHYAADRITQELES